MKKFTSTALGGAPIYDDDLLDIFNSEIWDAMQALLSPYNSDVEGIIVSGCVISGAGPYNITTGIVYLDGEFKRLPAQTAVTLSKYIASKAAVNDTRTFADSSSNVVAVTKDAELVSSVPGSGQYVAITSTTDPNDRRWNRAINNRPQCIAHGEYENVGGLYFQEGLITLTGSNVAGDYMRITHNLGTLNYSISVIGGYPMQYDKYTNYFNVRYADIITNGVLASVPGVQRFAFQIFTKNGNY